MQKVYTLQVYAVETHQSDRAETQVVLQFEGDLKPKTKKDIAQALTEQNITIHCKKKVLA